MGFFDSIMDMQKKILDKMAPDVTIKCSNCGASATGKATDKTIKCEYCGCFNENNKYISPADLAASVGNKNANNFDDDFDDDFDSFDRHHRMHRGRHGHSGRVVAWIEKGGLFYEGEIPGINFSKVSLCDSYEECVRKLREKYYKESSSAFFDVPVQDIEKIRREHPKAHIIDLD